MGSHILKGVITTAAIMILAGQAYALNGLDGSGTYSGPRATAPSLSVALGSIDGTCAGSNFILTSSWTNTVNDVPGGDAVGVIAYDWTGAAISSDWGGGTVGSNIIRETRLG